MNFKGKAILNKKELTKTVVISSPLDPQIMGNIPTNMDGNIHQKKNSKTPKKKIKNPPYPSVKKSFLGLSNFSLLLFAITITSLSAWIGYILILEPNSVLWINRFLPKSLQIPIAIQKAPQTLEVIKKEAQEENLIVGESMPLGEEILIPFYQVLKSCTENCQAIVEIRVYTPNYVNGEELNYVLLDLITIGELNGFFADQFKDFSEPLKLTKLELLENSPNTGGSWFNLSGETKDTTSIYGHILYYDPFQKNLSLMLPWQTKTKKYPHWQEITGKQYPELLINHSKVFDPLFQIYSLSINPEYNQFEQNNDGKKPYLKFTEISLDKPAISLSEYEAIMPQIEARLWNLALQNLNALEKQIHSSIWIEKATQQKDAIAFHGQIAQKQCKDEQDTIENQVTACLFNGDGTMALEHFKKVLMEKKKIKLEGILNWLKEDELNLKERLETTIKLNEFNEDLRIWQGLILYSQDKKETAFDLLENQQNIGIETIIKFEEIIKEIEITLDKNIDYKGHSSRIIATAIPLDNVNLNQWQNPVTREKLKPIKSPQKWYIIDVNSFYDGTEWNHFPFEYLNINQYSSSLSTPWKMLGLDGDSRIKIFTKKTQGREEITLATIQGIAINNGKIQLLAVGIPLDDNSSIPAQPLPLAYSESAFNNLELGAVSLLDLYQIQPQLMTKVLPKLWQTLPDKAKESGVNDIESILTKIGHWKVKTTDLTGNKQAEGILTLYTDENNNIDTIPFPQDNPKNNSDISQHTIIFSDQGDIIYNELKENSSEFMMTIADLKNDNPPVLLIDNGQGKYIMKIWSSTQQKFIEFN
jgi:hypothetical protein